MITRESILKQYNHIFNTTIVGETVHFGVQ
jgi:hypothetical protein